MCVEFSAGRPRARGCTAPALAMAGLLAMAAMLAVLWTSSPVLAQDSRRAVGCSPETIDKLPANSTLDDLQCQCFGRCTPTPPGAGTGGDTARPPPPNTYEKPNHPQPPADTRRFRVIEGRDIDGHDISRLREVSFQACVSACQADRQCTAISFDKWNRWCYLKHTLPDVVRIEPNSIVAYLSSARPRDSTAPVVIENYRRRKFVDSGYQSTRGSSFEQCKRTCSADDRCEAFTFVKSEGLCRLIADPGEHFRDDGYDSGVKRQAP